MNKRFVLMLLIFLCTFRLYAQLGLGNDPFTGFWKLNTAKSTASVPAPTTVQIKADAKGISFADSGNTTASAKFDGKDYPVKGSSVVDAVSYQRLGRRTIKSIVKARGQIVLTESMTVSEDGKTLTVSFTQFPGIAVFDKQVQERRRPLLR